MSQPTPQKYSPLNRFLMIFVPDSAANRTGIFICITSFLMGLMEIFSRQFAAAPPYFHLSIGMMFFLILMKFLSLRANMMVAQASHNLILDHLKKQREAARNKSKTPTDAEEKAAEAARERAEMVEAMSALKESLKHIPEDAPIYSKYEASIEMMERNLRRG
jgi:hypothetical protein